MRLALLTIQFLDPHMEFVKTYGKFPISLDKLIFIFVSKKDVPNGNDIDVPNGTTWHIADSLVISKHTIATLNKVQLENQC